MSLLELSSKFYVLGREKKKPQPRADLVSRGYQRGGERQPKKGKAIHTH